MKDRKITVFDETLCGRSGEVLLFREKTAIAKKADSYGADYIVLPPVKKKKEDGIVSKTISLALNGAKTLIKATAADEVADAAELALACGGGVIVELPVSPATMEYSFHVKDDGMRKKIAEFVAGARKCGEAMFCAVDATRTEPDALISFCIAAKDAGAGHIILSDDSCSAFPDDLAGLVRTVIEAVGLPVSVRPSNATGLGLACALEAIRAGASGVFCDSVGEKVPSLEFSELVREHGERLGISTGLRFTEAKNDSESIMSIIGGVAADDEKAVRSGAVLLDETSDPAQVRAAAESLGYELSDDDLNQVSSAVARVCVKKGSVGLREFEAIIASTARQVPSTYHVESYTVTSGNSIGAMAHVVLNGADGKVESVAYGDGPIDSAFHALEQCVGLHFELDDFQIQAVTEGREALGSAIVRLRSDGVLYSGNGISTDIVGASIRAYVNALNKIVYEGGK